MNKSPGKNLDLKFVTVSFLIITLLNFTVTSISHFLLKSANFPYRDFLISYKLPFFLTSLGNFDGAHYISIARYGYRNFEQAFFPLYPALIRLLGGFFHKNYFISAILISNIAFFLGLIFFYLFLQRHYDKKKIPWIFSFFLLFPASFFLDSVYSTSLFFLFSFATLFFIEEEKSLPAFFMGIIASLSRITGILMLIPIFFILLNKGTLKDYKHSIPVLLGPIVGLALYCLFLFLTTGDPLAFYSSQPAFGSNRSTHIILIPQVLYRYIKIFTTSNFNFQYFIAVVEFLTFILIFIFLLYKLRILLKKKNKDYTMVGLAIYSLSVLILPTFTGTFSSILRYAVLGYSTFLFLGLLKSRFIRIILLTIFLILHVIFLALFSQGYFIG